MDRQVWPLHMRVFHKVCEGEHTNVSVLIYRRPWSKDGMFNSELQIYGAAKYHWMDVNIWDLTPANAGPLYDRDAMYRAGTYSTLVITLYPKMADGHILEISQKAGNGAARHTEELLFIRDDSAAQDLHAMITCRQLCDRYVATCRVWRLGGVSCPVFASCHRPIIDFLFCNVTLSIS